ncbi:LAFA_0D08108g1_1 [Lachancea sp. 'fantastica']|nr:LAFA_0D08108g1_1 [Lachancea sp. 'fantastica']
MVQLQDIKEEEPETVATQQVIPTTTETTSKNQWETTNVLVQSDYVENADLERIALDETVSHGLYQHHGDELDMGLDLDLDLDERPKTPTATTATTSTAAVSAAAVANRQDSLLAAPLPVSPQAVAPASPPTVPFSASQECLLPPLPEDNTDLASPLAQRSQLSLESALGGVPSSSSRSTSVPSVGSPAASQSRAPSVVRRALSGSPLAATTTASASAAAITTTPTNLPDELPHSFTTHSAATTTEPFDLATAFEMRDDAEPNSSFDLSKALQISSVAVPTLLNTGSDNSVTTSGNINSITNNNTSSATSNTAPNSPHPTPPKLSFKKKFAAAGTGNTGLVDNAAGSKSVTDFPLQHLQRYGSVRSRTAMSDVPRINSSGNDLHHQGLGIESVDLVPSTTTHKATMRKFSVGSSSSSSRSFQENDEIDFFRPPPTFNTDIHSSTSLHDLKSPRSSLNLSESFNVKHKKLPLIKRASSAIWRKASLNKTSPASSPKIPDSPIFPNYKELQNTSSFATIPNSVDNIDRGSIPNVDDERPVNRKVNFSNSLIKLKNSGGGSRCVSSPERLHRMVSPATPLDGPNSSVSSDTQSLGTKFKNGLTRIISGNAIDQTSRNSASNTERAHALTALSASWNDKSETQNNVGLNTSEICSNGSNYTKNMNGGIQPSKQTSMKTKHIASNHSSSNGSGKKNHGTKNNATSSMNSTITAKNDSVFSGNSDESLEQTSDAEELTVDITELTKTLPIITVTEKLGAKSITPIQTQSNLILDLIYKDGGGAKSLANNNRKGAEPPLRISLKEYIDVLTKQQRVEDERFAVLEYKFAHNGWCSPDDLYNLQQKRIIINRKWAERISFYQGRLEA